MDTLEAISRRRSVRDFADKPIQRQTLEKIVDAGRRAPTARNVQPWMFVAVTEPAQCRALGELTDHGKFISDGAACIAVFCEDGKYYLEDGCAATQNMLLAATALGVGSCWVAGDKKDYAATVAKHLGVPDKYKLVSLIALGYPASEGGPKKKRPLSEVLHWERF